MTIQNFLSKKCSDLEIEQFLHDRALNSAILPIIQEWLREYALHICAEQRKICDNATDDLKEDAYSVLRAAYPEI